MSWKAYLIIFSVIWGLFLFVPVLEGHKLGKIPVVSAYIMTLFGGRAFWGLILAHIVCSIAVSVVLYIVLILVRR